MLYAYLFIGAKSEAEDKLPQGSITGNILV
jgi:hypothetical protein